jgi:hypothetical protein
LCTTFLRHRQKAHGSVSEGGGEAETISQGWKPPSQARHELERVLCLRVLWVLGWQINTWHADRVGWPEDGDLTVVDDGGHIRSAEPHRRPRTHVPNCCVRHGAASASDICEARLDGTDFFFAKSPRVRLVRVELDLRPLVACMMVGW